MEKDYALYPLGDQGITIVFGNAISAKIHERVKQAMQLLTHKKLAAVTEIVPTYTTVTVYYNSRKASYFVLKGLIEDCLAGATEMEISDEIHVIEVPVCYGGGYGPDLARVARYNQLSEEDVIRKHSSTAYLIYMMGFLPGFPYLGGLNPELATPRRASPRRSVSAGSVGIAGSQTGIYPLDSPGGWNIIGQTPVKIYQPEKQSPFLLQAGYYITFKSITSAEFTALKEN